MMEPFFNLALPMATLVMYIDKQLIFSVVAVFVNE